MFELPKLPYSYDALEPHFDAQTMEIHHTKHHQAYIDKANAALKGTEWENELVQSILADITQLPETIQAGVRNNAGGHANHAFFWELLCAESNSDITKAPTLVAQIEKDLGGLAKAKEDFANAAATRFGSGWAWIVWDGEKLKVTSTPNQDSPLSDGETPIIGLDVWEHAYYLHYQNRRPDYVGAFWNVLNWEQAEANLVAAQ